MNKSNGSIWVRTNICFLLGVLTLSMFSAFGNSLNEIKAHADETQENKKIVLPTEQINGKMKDVEIPKSKFDSHKVKVDKRIFKNHPTKIKRNKNSTTYYVSNQALEQIMKDNSQNMNKQAYTIIQNALSPRTSTNDAVNVTNTVFMKNSVSISSDAFMPSSNIAPQLLKSKKSLIKFGKGKTKVVKKNGYIYIYFNSTLSKALVTAKNLGIFPLGLSGRNSLGNNGSYWRCRSCDHWLCGFCNGWCGCICSCTQQNTTWMGFVVQKKPF
ncbi:hypothetical protein ACLJJ6_09715 [Pediococcus siamensis]|uniref:hypothetical protein n=1 Tax=Pediococcus siamensis TaxID=381829 RepID=UPI00399F30B8